MKDYLSRPFPQRLAQLRKSIETAKVAHYTQPNGKPYRTPIGTPTGGNKPFRVGSTLCVFAESPALRLVGFADEIYPRTVRHKGWYVADEPFQDETTRGMVFRLPHGRFLAAASDPFNDGPALLEVSESYGSDTDAALAADGLAERYAEDARESDAEQRAELEAQDAETEATERAYWEARDTITA